MGKINILVTWICNNKDWLLSGIGLAFIVFVINFIKRIWSNKKNKRGNLKISFTFKQAWEQSILGHSPVYPLYSFAIVNAGDEIIEIKDVQIYFCGKKLNTPYGRSDALTQVDTNNPMKYRGTIAPKKVIKGDFEITSFLPMINNQLKLNDNIRLLVTDTLGNKYYSKKTRYSNFLFFFQVSRIVNSKR